VKQVGTIVRLSRKRSYVFIQPEGEEPEVFCHRSELGDLSSLELELLRGLSVEFEMRGDDDGQAHRIRIRP